MAFNRLNDNSVSFIKGEFFDELTETNYVNYDIEKTKRFIKPLILFFGILYFLFIIPDYINLINSRFFYWILANRTLVFILIMILYFKLSFAKSYTFFYKWIAIYEIVLFASFLFTLSIYESPNVLIQTFGMMLIVISLFLVPSRWLYTLFISLFNIFAFYVITGLLDDNSQSKERFVSIVFLLIVLIISSISSLRTNYFKRLQYNQEKKLMEISITDPLTGCYNRLLLNEEFQKIYANDETKEEVSIILFDIDDFKVINDEYGHLVGDKILIEIVNLFKPLIDNNNLLVRWGGEEFMILIKNSGISKTASLAKDLKDLLVKHDFGIEIEVTCSFGIASSKECSSIDELLIKVDERMYKAKALGKNCVVSSL